MKRGNSKPVFQFTKEHFSDLREAFEIFDHEGMGLIPVKYMRIILRAFGFDADRNEISRLIECVGKEYEVYSIDRLTYDDFITILQRIMSTVPPLDFLVKAFRLYDAGNVGKLKSDDLERVANLLGDHLSEENIQDMIRSATNNESTTEVFIEDFLNILQKPFDPKLF